MANKILEVKNLKVSFRTSGGTVKAVRDISFDLERGRTLAIVGESGSGKSVTSKAILGILAGNSIVESGEIIYDGRDLLKIPEEEMCAIRGNRISMIFQDPLSSLNPIVKIGKQITEAMLLKNSGNRRAAKHEFNALLAQLKENMLAAHDASQKAKIEELIKTFNDFAIQATDLETSYNASFAAAEGLISDIEDFLFLAGKNQKLDVKARLKEFSGKLKSVKSAYLTKNYDAKLDTNAAKLQEVCAAYHAPKAENEPVLTPAVDAALTQIRDLLGEITAQTRPDFFSIGYSMLKNPGADLTAQSVETVNAETLKFLNDSFMNEFLVLQERGIEYSFRTALQKKQDSLSVLADTKAFFEGQYDKKSALAKANAAADVVEGAIDRLELNKDPIAYTFRTSLVDAIERYFTATVKNPKEEARYERQSKKRDALIAKGKTVDWKVVPKMVYDLDVLKNNIIEVVSRMIARTEAYIAAADTVDFHRRAEDMIAHFKAKASEIVYRVTKEMAKEKAIKLMEEVGIPEPRIRYYQYPFEFSGGMRQRIVIAIALAADPDILICDEPTTALDVTIQAQILELINRLKDERNLSVIFITHDLGVVANMADEIAVMYAGKIVEYGTADDVFYDPRHPYTWALLSSMPDLDTKEKLDAIPGTPPNMIYPPVGDAFADRNKYAMKIDFEMQPPQFPVSDTHWAATWLLHPDAPKVAPPKIITDRIERMKKKAEGGN